MKYEKEYDKELGKMKKIFSLTWQTVWASFLPTPVTRDSQLCVIAGRIPEASASNYNISEQKVRILYYKTMKRLINS